MAIQTQIRCLSALLVLVTVCVRSTTATSNETVLDPAQIQKLMGFGINLGNRLDLYGQSPRPVLEKYLEDFSAKGFTNVRIPVCWDGHTQKTAPYAINSTFMDLVETVVDWTLSRGMVAVLNTHHEKWLDNPSAFNSKLPRLEAIWTQIAERFKDKNQTLLFEIFNEPHLMSATQLNTMNAKVLPIIRATNPTRMVILMGLKFGNPSWHLQNPDGLVIPADPQVMVELHNYDPFKYAGANPSVHSWGSSSDRATLTKWVDDIDAWASKKNVKLYYGEWGCTSTQTHASGRDDWYQAHYAAIEAKGWATSVWSDGGKHVVYNYDDGTWEEDILNDIGRGSGPTPPTPPAPPAPPTPPAPPAQCAKAYGKCGGGGTYSGPTCCLTGCTCDVKHASYSRCDPPDGKHSCN